MVNVSMFVCKRSGKHEPVKFDKITERIKKLLQPNEIDYVDPIIIAQKVVATIFPGISTVELDIQSAEICANLSTVHHYYSNVAGRILVSNLHKSTSNHFVDKMLHIQKSLDIFDEKWISWLKKNKKEINDMMDYTRDFKYDYFAFKTLEKAYLFKIDDQIIERPQDVFMRVASFLNQGNLENTKKTYDYMSLGFYTHATPTLFNSGYKRSQLSSCFLLGTDDSMDGITHTWESVSKISKWSGGIGIHISNIRAKNSKIRGTNGLSSGIIPMLKVYNEIARYVNQGGKRKGSIAIYLEPWHPEILAFLDLRKNFGAETERARDLFLALWIPDLFMKCVEQDGIWYLMCPDECPGLPDVYGDEFETLYNKYVSEGKFRQKIEARKLMKAILDAQLETGTPYLLFKDTVNKKSNQKNIGTIKSSNLCSEILLYSDSKEYAVCNLCSIAINHFINPFVQEHKFTFYSKPLCKQSRFIRNFLKNNKWDFEEIDGTTIQPHIEHLPIVHYGETIIGGFNELYKFTTGKYDYQKLQDIAYTATINLDKVIDFNFYPTIETKFSNMKHRPIGVGIQGLADTLALLKIPFDSDEAVELNAKIMETIYYGCMLASKDIAKSRHDKMKLLMESNITFPEYYTYEFHIDDKELDSIYHDVKPNIYELNRKTQYYGSYSSFDGSPFSQGIFQFDMWNVKPSMTDKWDELKEQVKIYGVRNSQLTSLMPTATTSQIMGNNECFEYFTNNIYTRRTLAGDFPLVNKYLMNDLISVGLWNTELKDLILSYNGSIAEIQNIPIEFKKMYQTIWEIKQIWTLKQAISRAPFIDQTQSMNIYMAVPDYQKLFSSHMYAWKNGLKTAIYYLRTRPAQDAIKFTVDPNIQKNNQIENEQQIQTSITKRFVKPKDDEVCENCSA